MHKRSWYLGGGALITLLTLAVGIPLYAANGPAADFGKTVEFLPLVRHMISQVHCYDIGTDDCEAKNHLGTTFTKEHTLGFLIDGSSRKMSQLGFKPVYLCEARDNSGVMMVTGGLLENDPKAACRAAGFRYKQVGYISSTNQIEAPSALFRCVHPDTKDTLLSRSGAECSAASYGPAQLLGYLYAGGPSSL
jgi:hypothetical protein